MNNWSTDAKYLQKNHPEEYRQWRTLQLINYGLDGEKLDKAYLRSIWPKIKKKVISEDIRNYLEFILWSENQF